MVDPSDTRRPIPNRGDRNVGAAQPDSHRMLGRRSPIPQSDSGLASRDYQPDHGGPQLISSWPLGAPPTQDELSLQPWELTSENDVTIKEVILSPPYLTGPDASPAYLVVCGQGHVGAEGDRLHVSLSNTALSGKPYETEITLASTSPAPFMTPLIEVTPDRADYESKAWGPQPTKFVLDAHVTGDVAYLDPGTNVQLWSE